MNYLVHNFIVLKDRLFLLMLLLRGKKYFLEIESIFLQEERLKSTAY